MLTLSVWRRVTLALRLVFSERKLFWPTSRAEILLCMARIVGSWAIGIDEVETEGSTARLPLKRFPFPPKAITKPTMRDKIRPTTSNGRVGRASSFVSEG